MGPLVVKLRSEGFSVNGVICLCSVMLFSITVCIFLHTIKMKLFLLFVRLQITNGFY